MMPRSWAEVASKPDAAGIGLLVFVTLLATGGVLRMVLRRRPSPEELERVRRELILRVGKISDGEVIELEGSLITYQYSVAGVIYMATQDLSTLEAFLPSDLMTIIGPVCLRFDPRNPANSVVVCEQWSGLRHAAGQNRAPSGNGSRVA